MFCWGTCCQQTVSFHLFIVVKKDCIDLPSLAMHQARSFFEGIRHPLILTLTSSHIKWMFAWMFCIFQLSKTFGFNSSINKINFKWGTEFKLFNVNSASIPTSMEFPSRTAAAIHSKRWLKTILLRSSSVVDKLMFLISLLQKLQRLSPALQKHAQVAFHLLW